MKRKLYDATGMALLSLPATKKNRANNKRRNIHDMGYTSAARMIYVTDIRPEEPLIFCGKHNKAIPVIQQLIKKSTRPFVILGTRKDLDADSCLRAIKTEWESEALSRSLPDGNGILLLKSGAQTSLELKAHVSEWDSHLIIMCLGNGLQVDQELLNLLNSIGHYILLSDSIQRSIKNIDSCKLTGEDLLMSMEYIIVSSIGTVGKELLKILPDFEYEKLTNTIDFSVHQDSPHEYRGGHHHRNGGTLRLSQSKTLESRCIFIQEDLTRLQDSNTMLIHNVRNLHTWIAKITH